MERASIISESPFPAKSSTRSIVQCFLGWEPLLTDCLWRHRRLLNHANEDVISSDSGCFIALKIILRMASRKLGLLCLTSDFQTHCFSFFTGILMRRREAGTGAGASCVSEPEKHRHLCQQRHEPLLRGCGPQGLPIWHSS